MAPDSAPRLAARVLLIDPRDRLLLLRFTLPDGRMIWLPPGGGIEPGETTEAAAIREVLEETGIVLDSAGVYIWTRRTFFGGLDQEDRFFWLRLSAAEEVRSHLNPDATEAALTTGHRWWTRAEIVEAAGELFVPRTLGERLGPLLAGVLPTEPIEVGI